MWSHFIIKKFHLVGNIIINRLIMPFEICLFSLFWGQQPPVLFLCIEKSSSVFFLCCMKGKNGFVTTLRWLNFSFWVKLFLNSFIYFNWQEGGQTGQRSQNSLRTKEIWRECTSCEYLTWSWPLNEFFFFFFLFLKHYQCRLHCKNN